MALKVLRARTHDTLLENDLRGLGQFDEPMPSFELSLPFENEMRRGIEGIAAKWDLTVVVEEGWLKLTTRDLPHIQAVKQFFCAAELMREGLANALRIDLMQGVRRAFLFEDEFKRSKIEPGLLLDPALLYHFHQAGFWLENFSEPEIESLMQRHSLLHFSEENVAILMNNLGIEYRMTQGNLSHAK